jgi:hypothetical protein
LIYVDHGANLAIWDFRPNAKRRVTCLSAFERALYLYCDQHRSLRQIQDMGGDSEPTGARLKDWIENRLMIEMDGQYLSLAVNEESPSLSDMTDGLREPMASALQL